MNEFGNQSKSFLSELVRLNKYNLIACGYEQLTVTGSVASLTVPTDARYALIEVESSITTPSIRYLELGDKTLPTSSTGIRRADGSAFDVSGYQNLSNFRIIQISAGTHKLNIAYYK